MLTLGVMDGTSLNKSSNFFLLELEREENNGDELDEPKNEASSRGGSDILWARVSGHTTARYKRATLMSPRCAYLARSRMVSRPGTRGAYGPVPELRRINASGPVLVPSSSTGSKHARY